MGNKQGIGASAAGLGVLVFVVVATYAWAEDKTIFNGCDRHMANTYGESCSDWTVNIVKKGGKYYMDGSEMEVMRHPNMPKDGLSITMKDSIGKPNMYWLVRPKKLDIYINCEFGSCNYQRSITGTCCATEFKRFPAARQQRLPTMCIGKEDVGIYETGEDGSAEVEGSWAWAPSVGPRFEVGALNAKTNRAKLVEHGRTVGWVASDSLEPCEVSPRLDTCPVA